MISTIIETGVQECLKKQGIQIIGIAEMKELSPVPREFSPQSILREAQSIICYGVPIPRGIVYADNNDLSMYWRYCTMVYKSIDMVSNRLAVFLEEKGHKTSPIYGCYPMKIVNKEYWGLVPLVYWAEEAGLGKLTRCGLLAHPDYGTRMIIGGVITSVSLLPTEKIQGDPCPPDCYECINKCSVNAIDKTGKVDHTKCMRYANASPPLSSMIRDKTLREQFSMETMLNTIAVDEHATYSCIECLKVCPLNTVRP